MVGLSSPARFFHLVGWTLTTPSILGAQSTLSIHAGNSQSPFARPGYIALTLRIDHDSIGYRLPCLNEPVS